MDLDTVRAISLAIWSAVALFQLPSILRLLRKQARYYDVLWTLVGFFGVDVAGFNLRALLAHPSIEYMTGLHCFSIMLAIASLVVMARYQRSGNEL